MSQEINDIYKMNQEKLELGLNLLKEVNELKDCIILMNKCPSVSRYELLNDYKYSCYIKERIASTADRFITIFLEEIKKDIIRLEKEIELL